MTVNAERLQLGIEALESDEFKQGKRVLCGVTADGTKTYCCLGVLTEVAIRNGLNLTRNEIPEDQYPDNFVKRVNYLSDNQNQSTVLVAEVIDWYGFDDDNPNLFFRDHPQRRVSAARANDMDNRTFREIADAFRYTYIEH